MRIIEIAALDNGAHRNQSGEFSAIPFGWAVAPDDLHMENFPFGEVVAESVDGVPTVTRWTPGVVPEKVDPSQNLPNWSSSAQTWTSSLWKWGLSCNE
jgi:hypothetical protein